MVNATTYEHQNDDSLSHLLSKAHSLSAYSVQREVTVQIHQDADQQRSMIDDTSTAFDRFQAGLSTTARRLSTQAAQYARSHRLTTGIVAAFVAVWALWFLFF
ncbi:hypothetical protein MSPP1_003493 [Malassezia sp. CBS 17886]|nr:hypothetical protein MSPP1_003493 [Malassezia sp. CBS 17886]